MISYKIFPKLKDIALTNVAVAIWNQDTLKSLASSEHHSDRSLERAELNARGKASKLILPNPLNKELLNVITVIGLELRSWVQFHARLGTVLGADSPATSKFEFHWTSYGTIDKKRTAEAIIENENVHALTRFKYACEYCLESSICTLWEKLDGNSKRALRSIRFNMQSGPLFPEVNILENNILKYWSFIMDFETYLLTADINNVNLPNFEDVYSYTIKGAVFGGNDIALKYFLETMTTEERKLSIIGAANLLASFSKIEFSKRKRSYKMYYSNLLCLLLSLMNETEQIEVFRNDACGVLSSLLEWPWQQFFIPTVRVMWKYLSQNDFRFQICLFLDPDYLGVYTDYNYQDIFKQFWEESPPTHKKCLLDGPVHKMLLISSLSGHKENILMMMRHATPEQNLRILHLSQALHCYLIGSGDLYILKFLLLKSVPSNDKSKIIELNAGLVPIAATDMASKKTEMHKLFEFVLNFIERLDKRGVNEDEIALNKIPIENQILSDFWAKK